LSICSFLHFSTWKSVTHPGCCQEGCHFSLHNSPVSCTSIHTASSVILYHLLLLTWHSSFFSKANLLIYGFNGHNILALYSYILHSSKRFCTVPSINNTHTIIQSQIKWYGIYTSYLHWLCKCRHHSCWLQLTKILDNWLLVLSLCFPLSSCYYLHAIYIYKLQSQWRTIFSNIWLYYYHCWITSID
jgi:hypothetical protein